MSGIDKRPKDEPAVDPTARYQLIIPNLSDTDLASLQANATRLSQDDTGRRQQEAVMLLPLVDAELAVRKTAKTAAAAAKRKLAKPRVKAIAST